MDFTRSLLLYLAILAGAGATITGTLLVADAMCPAPDLAIASVR